MRIWSSIGCTDARNTNVIIHQTKLCAILASIEQLRNKKFDWSLAGPSVTNPITAITLFCSILPRMRAVEYHGIAFDATRSTRFSGLLPACEAMTRHFQPTLPSLIASIQVSTYTIPKFVKLSLISFVQFVISGRIDDTTALR